MRIIKYAVLCPMAALSFVVLTAAPAQAQATRTWVSGVGDDVNPCSRTAPCKTFAGAISKTAAGGEINCLDPGGFGAVTIIKSMTISCPYTEGGALAGGNGIVVNMPATTDVTFIRGLDIFGVNPPTNGIRFVNNGTLHVEDTVIRRFNAANSLGISYQPSGASKLFLSNLTIAENGNAATGGGILIQPTGAGGSAEVQMRNVRVHNNANTGIRVDSTGNTSAAGIGVSIEDSSVSGSGGGGIALVSPAGTNSIVAMIVDSAINDNVGTGLIGNGTGVTARVGNTTITGNATGVNPAGGSTLISFGTNRNFGNPTVGAANNGAFSGAIQPQN
jgi:hypothetical protein